MKIQLNLILFAFFMVSAYQLSGATINQDSLNNEGGKLKIEVNSGFSNKYLWRGITYNNGLVFQPEVVLTLKDFYVSSWGNFKLYDVDNTNSNEIDFTAGYYHSFNSFDIECYFSYYNYFYSPGDNTAEINPGVYFPTGDFTLFARSSFDLIMNPGGFYGEIGCDYEKELSDKFSFSGTLLTGIGSKKFNEYYLTDSGYPQHGKTSLNLVSCKVGLSYSPFKSFSIDGGFLMNINIDKDVKKSLGKTSNMFELVLRKEF